MKNKIIVLLALISIWTTQTLSAQKIKVMEGSLSALQGVSKMNVKFDYSNMSVGKFENEADYISKKKADYNKKEAGKGEAWEQDWIKDRTERYAPQFEELFNKNGKIQVGDFPAEKYTMIVKTTKTEPGYNIAISRKNAEIAGEIQVVETASPGNVVVKLSFEKGAGPQLWRLRLRYRISHPGSLCRPGQGARKIYEQIIFFYRRAPLQKKVPVFFKSCFTFTASIKNIRTVYDDQTSRRLCTHFHRAWNREN